MLFTKMLIPLDGSKTAEKVLPYARALGGFLKIPVELLAVVDIADMAAHVGAAKARLLDTLAEDAERGSRDYLNTISAKAAGVDIRCTIAKGSAAETIIEKAAADRNTLIAMATHGRSGLDRWILGSVTEKVLRGCQNPLLLVRAGQSSGADEKVAFKSIIVPLDGSQVAEGVLPAVITLARAMEAEVILFRAYHIPYSAYAAEDGYSAINYDELIASEKDEATEYLKNKTAALKEQGVEKVSYNVKEGLSSDEIIALGRATPDHLIAMCSHGRSGVRRWVLGSVTETVLRHSGDPVLVLRAG